MRKLGLGIALVLKILKNKEEDNRALLWSRRLLMRLRLEDLVGDRC